MTRKRDIDQRIRDKFEELGVDAVRSKLGYVLGVRGLDQLDQREVTLEGGLVTSGREMQQWLNKKAASEARWAKTGVIAAVIAALLAALAAWLAYLALPR